MHVTKINVATTSTVQHDQLRTVTEFKVLELEKGESIFTSPWVSSTKN
jgi:hypothetical protein